MAEFILSWRWLWRFDAYWTAVFFFLVDFGILSIANAIDYYLIRGPTRPLGHWGFWMVVVFDFILLPMVGYFTARFWQTSDLKPLLGGWDVWISTGFGTIVAVLFLWHSYHTSKFSPGGDWTTGNIAGVWHTLVLGMFTQYLMLVAIRGHQYWWPFGTSNPSAARWFWLSASYILIAGLLWTLMDEDLLDLGIPRPNELLENWIPWWPKNY